VRISVIYNYTGLERFLQQDMSGVKVYLTKYEQNSKVSMATQNIYTKESTKNLPLGEPRLLSKKEV